MDIETLQSMAIYTWLQEHMFWVLPSVALLACIESFALIGVVLPGVLLLGASALFCSIIGIPLWQLLVATWIGAVTGDGLSFLIGRFGRRLRTRLPQRQLRWMALCEPLVMRYGWMAVAGARFVGPLRPIMPLVAGFLGMQPFTFGALNMVTGWRGACSIPCRVTGWGTRSRPGMPQTTWLLAGLGAALALGVGLIWLRQRMLRPSP